MKKESNLPRNFVLQLGSLVTLYISLIFLIVLLFGLINIIFPDSADSVWQIESTASQVRFGIAMVLVFFPTYLILTRTVNKIRRKADGGVYLTLTKWLIYLSLLLGGLILLGDLVAIIMAFLEGEITQRFIAKALVMLFVIGAAFDYYLLDAKGYWVRHEKKSLWFAAMVSLIVLASLIVGFFNIEPPAEVREGKIDQQQVQDLQQIQWRIQDHLAINQELPETLEQLDNPRHLPEAPEEREAYQYNLTEDGFELCATFKTESPEEHFFGGRAFPGHNGEEKVIVNPDNWSYSEGRECFERVVQ